MKREAENKLRQAQAEAERVMMEADNEGERPLREKYRELQNAKMEAEVWEENTLKQPGRVSPALETPESTGIAGNGLARGSNVNKNLEATPLVHSAAQPNALLASPRRPASCLRPGCKPLMRQQWTINNQLRVSREDLRD